jgi:hypothetical protein
MDSETDVIDGALQVYAFLERSSTTTVRSIYGKPKLRILSRQNHFGWRHRRLTRQRLMSGVDVTDGEDLRDELHIITHGYVLPGLAFQG